MLAQNAVRDSMSHQFYRATVNFLEDVVVDLTIGVVVELAVQASDLPDHSGEKGNVMESLTAFWANTSNAAPHRNFCP